MLQLAKVDDVLAKGGCVLDPGCGAGAFLLEVLRRAAWHGKEQGKPLAWVVERVHGVEQDSRAAKLCLQKAKLVLTEAGYRPSSTQVARLVTVGDFLTFEKGNWDLVVGNPPYVRIEGLSQAQRQQIRLGFRSAVNRFDLYFAFFEKSLHLLRDGGELVFITPQKFMQVWSASGLRKILAENRLLRIELVDEQAFPGLITYPAITCVQKGAPGQDTVLVVEDERRKTRRLVPVVSLGSAPWREAFGDVLDHDGLTLADVTDRIAVGIATGADKVFEVSAEEARGIPPEHLRYWVGGRQLPKGPRAQPALDQRILWPYDAAGHLLPEEEIPEVMAVLRRPHQEARLKARTCAKRRPWYAFHERPRPEELARPKILTQDIQMEPAFHIDAKGTIPKHSIYYIVPKQGVDIEALAAYLNGPEVRDWLKANCQPAAGGRIRLQSWVLRDLPMPQRFGEAKRKRKLAPLDGRASSS